MRKVKISFALLIFVLLMTFTTAYAWLTLANVNRVQDISLNAVAQQDLLISLDGENFYDEIPKELILEKLKQLKFDDVTSFDGINFYSYYNYQNKAKQNKDYISLDIYFQTTSRYKELHLSDNLENVDYENTPQQGTYIISKGRFFESQVDYEYSPNEIIKAGDVRQYFAHEAMRVSFYNYLDDTTKMFDLSGNADRGFGKAYGAIDYYQKHNGISLTIPKAPEVIYELSTFSEVRPIAETYSSLLITLIDQGNKNIKGETLYEGKIQMNIWLEAWDADAFDAIQTDVLKMQFMFRAVIPAHEL